MMLSRKTYLRAALDMLRAALRPGRTGAGCRAGGTATGLAASDQSDPAVAGSIVEEAVGEMTNNRSHQVLRTDKFMPHRLTMCLMGLLLLTSCATVGGGSSVDAPKPKVALVLGGGAARGFAHVGVIRALEQEIAAAVVPVAYAG